MIVYTVAIKTGYDEKFNNLINNFNTLVGDDAVKLIAKKDVVAVPRKEGEDG